jgi:stage II sporulation protein M
MAKRKKSRKKLNLKKEYRKSWNYIREARNYIYIMAGIFLLFVLIGLFVPVPSFLYDKIMAFIKELLLQTKNMSMPQLIVFIISNNLKSTFLGILLGAVFGIFPVIDAVANGYMLGFASLLSIDSGGITSLWRIFPHGIFELPAIFLSLGLGIKLGTFILQKDKKKAFRDYLINSMRVFLLIIIPLLVVAGIIEGTLIVLLK